MSHFRKNSRTKFNCLVPKYALLKQLQLSVVKLQIHASLLTYLTHDVTPLPLTVKMCSERLNLKQPKWHNSVAAVHFLSVYFVCSVHGLNVKNHSTITQTRSIDVGGHSLVRRLWSWESSVDPSECTSEKKYAAHCAVFAYQRLRPRDDHAHLRPPHAGQCPSTHPSPHLLSSVHNNDNISITSV